MERKLIVSLYYLSDQQFIEIDVPKDGDILDLDFNGKYLVQCKLNKGAFILTGNGIDGGGNSLSSNFYENAILE